MPGSPAVFDIGVHVIVVGCGRVGSRLASAIVDEGHSVAVIDKNPGSFRRLLPGVGAQTFVGVGFDRDTLTAAGAEEADALAAVTSGDNSNILTARIARENFQIPDVVARIYDPRRAEIYQRLGIVTVATVAWTIDQVLRGLLPGRSDAEWIDPTGQIELVERRVPGPWAGRSVAALESESGAKVVALTRSGVPMLDVAGLVCQSGDLLHLVFATAHEERVRAVLGEPVPLGRAE